MSIVVCCDGCAQHAPPPERRSGKPATHDARAAARDQGWVLRYINRKPMDLCPTCKINYPTTTTKDTP